MKKLVLILLIFASSTYAHAENCTERDYSGLILPKSKNYEMYNEMVCQFKVLLKKRTTQETLPGLIDLASAPIGISSKNLNWQQPSVLILNDLLNFAIANGRMQQTALASQAFFARGKFQLSGQEASLLDALTKIEIQNH